MVSKFVLCAFVSLVCIVTIEGTNHMKPECKSILDEIDVVSQQLATCTQQLNTCTPQLEACNNQETTNQAELSACNTNLNEFTSLSSVQADCDSLSAGAPCAGNNNCRNECASVGLLDLYAEQ